MRNRHLGLPALLLSFFGVCCFAAPKQANAWRSPSCVEPALQAFSQQLVEQFAPEQVILFGSQIRAMRRPDDVAERYLGGDPIIREALDHGRVLHG